MDKLFPLPIYSFIKIISHSGGISFNKIKNIPPWLIKTVLLEPLRWAELAIYNKEIRNHQIPEDPIFILGYYRSGTSYLHQCLALDHRLGYHSNFQMVFPEIMLSSEKYFLPLIEDIIRVFKIKDSVHRVPLSFRFPGEEDVAMTTSLNYFGAQWGYFFPEIMNEHFSKYVLFDKIDVEEKRRWKEKFIYLIKKISIANKGKQLVLKSPPNTARIKFLLNLFPKAKFVFIHRNPYQVYASNKRFWGVVQNIYALQNTKEVDVNKIILDTYSQMTSRYLEERSLIPKGQLVELAYHDFIRNPLENLRNVYNDLNLPEFREIEEKLRNFTKKQREFVELKHQIPDFEKNRVNEAWKESFQNWGYPFS